MCEPALFHGEICALLGRRIQRHRSVSRFDAFVVSAPDSAGRWHGLGDVLLLVPGLARWSAIAAEGAPLIIDENCLHCGPWAGTSSSTGEARLADLEAIAKQVRMAGGVVIGVVRAQEVPDVNLQRLRSIYELRVDLGQSGQTTSEPRLVKEIRRALDSSPGGYHA